MSKQFPHVHSFRLSDGDEKKLTNLMNKFAIDFSKEHSAAFRLFVKRLYTFISDLDAEGEGKGEMHSATQGPSVSQRMAERIERAAQVESDEDLSEEQLKISKDRGRVGRLIFSWAFKEIKGDPKIQLSPVTLMWKQREIRRRFKVSATNLDTDPDDLIKRHDEWSKNRN